MCNPLVSIVTVTYNAQDTIEETILSVINQDYDNIEYIIIDGNSKDSTVDIIKKHEDRISYWVSEPDKGLYDAMNKGIKIAKGEWITFRNSGDLFLERDSLSKLFKEPISESTDVIYADCIHISEEGYKLSKPRPLTTYRRSMPINHPATFIRTALHKEIPFDLQYKISADYNMIYRCIEMGKQFEYRPVAIVSFPIGGFANTHWKDAIKECCRIQGRTKSLGGWAYTYCNIVYVWFHLKIIMPISKLFHKKEEGEWKPLPLPYKNFY